MKRYLSCAVCALLLAFSAFGGTISRTEKQPIIFGTGSGISFAAGVSANFTGATVTGLTVSVAFADVTGTPTSLAGYGITDPVALTTASYSDPAWITHLAWSKITGTPTSVAGYGITDSFQPLDSDLTALAALSTDSFGRLLLTKTDAATVRSYIGAGTSNFNGTFSGLSAKPTTLSGYGITDAQPLDSDLTALAALTTDSFGRALLTKTDGASILTYVGAQPLDGDLTALAALSGTNNIYYRSASNTWTSVTIGAGLDFTSGTLSSSGSSVAWGAITGTLSDQTDLQSALDAKQDIDADLTAVAALTTDSFGLQLLTKTSGANIRSYIGAGTSSFDGAFSSLTGTPTTLSGYGITDAQGLDSDLTTLAGLTATTDNFIISVGSAWASRTPSQARTTLGLVIGTNVEAWDADLDTWATKTPYAGTLTITTGKTFDVTNNLTLSGTDGSTLAIGTGGTLGTAAYTASSAYQPIDTDLTTIAGLTATTDNFLVSVSSAWASRTPTQVKTTLGLTIGTNVEAWDADLDTWAGITPGTGVGTALAINVGSAGAFVTNGGALGTPSSGTLTNATGLPVAGITASTSTALGVGSIELGHATDTTLSRASSGVLAVEGVNVLLNGGALGTPSSGTLTNATGLPIAGLTSSTSTALGVGSIELGNASDTTIARSGAGAITVEGTSVLLSGGALGTPSSGTLTNATGLPVAGITSSTSTALGVGSVELGAASDTTIARASAGRIQVEGNAVLNAAPRVTSISSNATWSPNADTDDVYEITAQAADVTTISNPSGSPLNGQKLIIRVTGTAARALTWSGSQWRASSDLALPTTTTTTKTMYLGFIYNSTGPKWDLVAKLDNF